MIRIEKNKICFHYDAEELWIEPWGKNALRIRATKEAEMPLRNWALMEPETSCCEIKETLEGAEITNGKIRATITKLGKIMVYDRKGTILLEEYWRNRRDLLDEKCSAIEVEAREFRPNVGGDYHLTMRFESQDIHEKIFGMGQYQQP